MSEPSSGISWLVGSRELVQLAARLGCGDGCSEAHRLLLKEGGPAVKGMLSSLCRLSVACAHNV